MTVATTQATATLDALLASTVHELQRPRSGAVTTPFQLSARDLAEPEATAYLASLQTLPLSTLHSLPVTLAATSTALDQTLSNLAFKKYTSFLVFNSSTKSVATSFTSLSKSLSELEGSTSALEDANLQFSSRITSIKSKRDRLTTVKDKLGPLEDLLNSFGLVDACVKAGFWSEAIDILLKLSELLAYSSVNPSTNRGAIALLQRIEYDVTRALISLRTRVLESLLQKSLKLPGAVRAIVILQRINRMGNSAALHGVMGGEMGFGIPQGTRTLRIIFLTARWKCLQVELESIEGQMMASGIQLHRTTTLLNSSLLESVDNDERTRWIKKWVEVWREIVGETIAMYTEVFLSGRTGDAGEEEGDDPLSSTTSISTLALFLSTALASLSSVLTTSVQFLTTTAALSPLYTQTSYCSHSFARYGLEFREFSSIQQTIEARAGVLVTEDLARAGQAWEIELREGWEGRTRKSGAARRSRIALADWLVVPEGLAALLSTPRPSSVGAPWQPAPLPALALLPPLAHLLNAHANAFNSLRLLPALSLYPSLRSVHARGLDRATRVLEAFIEAWSAATGPPPSGTVISGVGLSEEREALSPEELQAKRNRADERQLVQFVVAAFGRSFLPWSSGALCRGVYADAETHGLEDNIVKLAQARIEAILKTLGGEDIIEDRTGSVLEPVSEIRVQDEVAGE